MLWHVEHVVFDIKSLLTEVQKDLTEPELPKLFELRNIDQKSPVHIIWKPEHKPSTNLLSIGRMMSKFVIIRIHFAD